MTSPRFGAQVKPFAFATRKEVSEAYRNSGGTRCPAGPAVRSDLLALKAFDLGLLALLVGALTGRRGTALGVAGAVAALAYVISSLAPVVGWVHHLRYLSPFYWSVGADQLRTGSDLLGTCLLVLTGLVLALGARTALRRLDLH